MPTWDARDDWGRLRDATGMVAGPLGDHAGAGTVQQGYRLGSLTDGLVAYYPMDSGEGSVLFDGATGNHGQINGATWNGSGQVGSDCLSFDGTDDNVSVEDNSQLDLEVFTVSAWVKVNTFDSSFNSIVNKYSASSGGNYGLSTTNSNEFNVNFTTDSSTNYISAESSISPSTGIWYHLVGTYDQTELTLYVDGVEEGSVSETESPNKTPDPLYIGERGDGNHFPGLIDEVRIYDRALSQPEIQALAGLTQPSGRAVGESDVPSQGDNGVSRYEFENDVTDSWGGNDGTDNTSAGFVTGVYGSAKDFDGTDDRVELPDLGLSSSSSFSLSAWFKPSDVSGFEAILARSDTSTNDYLTFRSTDADMQFSLGHSGGSVINPRTPAVLTTGEWHHAVGVFKSGGPTAEVYVNGKLMASQTGQLDDFANSNGPWIGGRTDDTSYWDGAIDDVRIYSTALSPREVEQLYNLGAWRIARSDTI